MLKKDELNEFEKHCSEIAYKAEKEFEKVEKIVQNVIYRALEGKITIVDKKEIMGNEIVGDEVIEERMNDLLYKTHEDEDFLHLRIYLKSIYDNKRNFYIFYPHNSFSGNIDLFNIKVNIINSVSDFISKIIDSKSDIKSYYRGHGCWKYDMEPGIYRKMHEGVLKKESIFIREIVSMYPQYFKECHSALDYLSVLQHNGFPTRLLDFTENPLVALYMACCSSEENHADIIELKVSDENIKFYDSDTVSILSNLAWFDDDFISDKNICKEEYNKKNDVKRLIHQIRNEKPYFEEKIQPEDLSRIVFVKSKHSFERISRQSGLFALFGIEYTKTKRPKIENMDGIKEITHYIIPYSLKKKVIYELDCLGINQASMYCDLGSILQHYVNNCSNHISEINKKIKKEIFDNPF